MSAMTPAMRPLAPALIARHLFPKVSPDLPILKAGGAAHGIFAETHLVDHHPLPFMAGDRLFDAID
jgi:hypothetical protein